jgi:hypothetical protein
MVGFCIEACSSEGSYVSLFHVKRSLKSFRDQQVPKE